MASPLPKPRTIEEAQQQGRVWGRAKRLWQDGYSVREVEFGYEVKSPEGEAYVVDPIFDYCSCPFYKEHEYCKHVLGLPYLLDNQRGAELVMLARMGEEQTARVEAEGPNGCDFSDGALAPGGCQW